MTKPSTLRRSRATLAADCSVCLRTTDCWPSIPAAITQARAQRLPTLARGDVLWRQSEGFRGLFIVTQGSLKLVERAAEGIDTVAGFRFPGDLLGLDALADGQHPDEAVALEPVAVCRIDWDRAAEADRYAALERELLLRQVNEARRLRRQRRSLHRGADLASFLGIANETVSRALHWQDAVSAQRGRRTPRVGSASSGFSGQ